MKNTMQLNSIYTNEEIIKFYNEKNDIMTSRNLRLISGNEFLYLYLKPSIKADLLQSHQNEKGKRNLIIRLIGTGEDTTKTLIVNQSNIDKIDIHARRRAYVSPFLTFGFANIDYSTFDKKKILCFDIDIDGFPDSVLFEHIMSLMFDEGKIPVATFIINSGTGIHLIYLFKDPLENTEETQLFKEALCRKIDELLFHTNGQSQYHQKLQLYKALLHDKKKYPHVDCRPVVQLFRIPSSLTKIGEELAETHEEKINNIATCAYTGVLY